MEYISSDTNVWLDFATINRLEIPFKLTYTYIMNEDAITDELLSPKELRDNLVGLGMHQVQYLAINHMLGNRKQCCHFLLISLKRILA